MAARVQAGIRPVATGTFFAGCVTCNWMPPKYFKLEDAEADALHHNDLFHDGADLSITLDEITADDDVELRRLNRWLVVHVGFMLAGWLAISVADHLDTTTTSTTWALIHGTGIGCLAANAFLAGICVNRKHVVRRVRAMKELSFSYDDPGLE